MHYELKCVVVAVFVAIAVAVVVVVVVVVAVVADVSFFELRKHSSKFLARRIATTRART